MAQFKKICILPLHASLTGCGGYGMFDPTSSFTSSGYTSGKSPEWKNASANSSSDTDSESTGTTSTPTAAAIGKNDTNSLPSLFARAAQSNASTPPPAPSAVAKPVVVADARETAVASPVPPPAAEKVMVEPRG